MCEQKSDAPATSMPSAHLFCDCASSASSFCLLILPAWMWPVLSVCVCHTMFSAELLCTCCLWCHHTVYDAYCTSLTHFVLGSLSVQDEGVFQSLCTDRRQLIECSDACGCTEATCQNRAIGRKQHKRLGEDVRKHMTYGMDPWTRHELFLVRLASFSVALSLTRQEHARLELSSVFKHRASLPCTFHAHHAPSHLHVSLPLPLFRWQRMRRRRMLTVSSSSASCRHSTGST